MKFILFFILTLILFSCNPQLENRWKIIEKNEEKELTSGIRNDTIFLGFRFGMSPNDLENHCKELIKSGKIQFENDSYYYTFRFGSLNKIDAKLNFHFFNDSLYLAKMEIIPGPNENEHSIFNNIIDLFKEKYSNPKLIPTSKTETDLLLEKIENKKGEVKNKVRVNTYEKDYLWIKGNKKIIIEYPYYYVITINYTDIILEREMEALEKNKESRKSKNSQKNLNNIVKDL